MNNHDQTETTILKRRPRVKIKFRGKSYTSYEVLEKGKLTSIGGRWRKCKHRRKVNGPAHYRIIYKKPGVV